MFQLTEDEYKNLMSQFVISSSKHGGVRKMPYAFTEEGIYMLATVLRSPIAVQTSIAIIRTITNLREFSKHYNALAKQLIEIDRKYEKCQIKVNCFTFIASKPKRSEQSVAV